MVFLVDVAKDVERDNVKRQMEFIISVASTISFRNIGVISYATEAEIVIRPGQLWPPTAAQLAQTLRDTNYSSGHLKNLGKALTKSQDITELFNPSKPGLIVAMISGKSHDDSSLPAEKLKEKGVTIIALVFGTSYSQAQLTLVVSTPENDHKLMTDFASLNNFISSTRNAICRGDV